MSVEIPDVLRLIGGTPHLHTARVFAERLKVTKALIGGGDISSLLASVVNGGVGSVLSNPLSGQILNLQSAVSIAITQAQAAIPAMTSLVEALNGTNGLQSIVTSLGSFTNGLSGLGGGPFSILDIVSHDATLTSLGAAAPENVTMPAALSPMGLGQTLDGITQQLTELIDDLTTGDVVEDDAVDQVTAMGIPLQSAMDESTTAFNTLKNAAQGMAEVSVATAALTVSTQSVQEHIVSLIGADTANSIREAEDEFFSAANDQGTDNGIS